MPVLGMPHLQKCSRPVWVGLWASWHSGRYPCSWQGCWTKVIFQPKLSFGSVILSDNSHLVQVTAKISQCSGRTIIQTLCSVFIPWCCPCWSRWQAPIDFNEAIKKPMMCMQYGTAPVSAHALPVSFFLLFAPQTKKASTDPHGISSLLCRELEKDGGQIHSNSSVFTCISATP